MKKKQFKTIITFDRQADEGGEEINNSNEMKKEIKVRGDEVQKSIRESFIKKASENAEEGKSLLLVLENFVSTGNNLFDETLQQEAIDHGTTIAEKREEIIQFLNSKQPNGFSLAERLHINNVKEYATYVLKMGRFTGQDYPKQIFDRFVHNSIYGATESENKENIENKDTKITEYDKDEIPLTRKCLLRGTETEKIEFEKKEWIIENFIYQNRQGDPKFFIFAGDGGIGKTTSLFQMAFSIVAGIPFMENKSWQVIKNNRPVIIASADDSTAELEDKKKFYLNLFIEKELIQKKDSNNILHNILLAGRDRNVLDLKEEKDNKYHLTNLIEDLEILKREQALPSTIIIDNFSRLVQQTPFNPDTLAGVSALADILGEVAEMGITIISIHHTNKDVQKMGAARTQGNYAINGLARQCFLFDRARKVNDKKKDCEYFSLVITKTNDMPLNKYTIEQQILSTSDGKKMPYYKYIGAEKEVNATMSMEKQKANEITMTIGNRLYCTYGQGSDNRVMKELNKIEKIYDKDENKYIELKKYNNSSTLSNDLSDFRKEHKDKFQTPTHKYSKYADNVINENTTNDFYTQDDEVIENVEKVILHSYLNKTNGISLPKKPLEATAIKDNDCVYFLYLDDKDEIQILDSNYKEGDIEYSYQIITRSK